MDSVELMEEVKLTNHVIAVLIPHQGLQWTIPLVVQCRQAGHDVSSLLIRAELNALLHNVAGEFVL